MTKQATKKKRGSLRESDQGASLVQFPPPDVFRGDQSPPRFKNASILAS